MKIYVPSTKVNLFKNFLLYNCIMNTLYDEPTEVPKLQRQPRYIENIRISSLSIDELITLIKKTQIKNNIKQKNDNFMPINFYDEEGIMEEIRMYRGIL